MCHSPTRCRASRPNPNPKPDPKPSPSPTPILSPIPIPIPLSEQVDLTKGEEACLSDGHHYGIIAPASGRLGCVTVDPWCEANPTPTLNPHPYPYP